MASDSPTSSQYGSLDAAKASLSLKNEQNSNLSDCPPKPAVRKRIQQVAAVKGNKEDLSASSGMQSVKVAKFEENKAFIEDNNNSKQEEEFVDELNKSITNLANQNAASNPPKNSLALQLPQMSISEQRAYPKQVFFIVTNEFCERFSYYGMRTVLVLYFKSVLGFSESNSTISFHLFATLCYLTPIFGAILGDSIWGKYKTILYLSILYFLGELILVISSIFWNLGTLSPILTFFGLFMIGIGTGGIKPCVSTLGGDQFLAHEEKWRQAFFSLFYASINLGSLISMFLTPILRSEFHCVNRNDCYPYAFGLPCLLVLIGTIIFIAAKGSYNLVPVPEKNVIIAFSQCVWLAFKRKIGLSKTSSYPSHQRRTQTCSLDTSSSSLSAASNESAPVCGTRFDKLQESDSKLGLERKHWLYLASDRFDNKTIEESRSVLGILLLFVPLPIYWCLYDQQSSLWTLQATRMDGRLLGTNFVLQPDQMSVLNPVLMLAAIPIFEIFIYPSLRQCNLLTKPIQRMTVGGFIAALTFVISALIELQIQANLPPSEPFPGRANLLLVNGLGECSITNPTIHYVQIPDNGAALLDSLSNTSANDKIDSIEPLGWKYFDILSDNESLLNNYQLKFNLTSGTKHSLNGTASLIGCPYESKKDFEFRVGPLPDKSVRLLYVEQGNGKLTYKMFNESLHLPDPGKARVRLLYEFFGSSASAGKRQFFLSHLLSEGQLKFANLDPKLQFQSSIRDGQVILSDYLDVEVPINGGILTLRTNDNLLNSNNTNHFKLKPGTRNLIIIHQRDFINFEVKHELLQDNDYRISMLYQLAPYFLISVSEVMFSITGLEFCYSMAPDSMKSVIMGAWQLTTAFGNMFTVAIESLHLFANIAHDFLFYATIMAMDMVLFACMGYYFSPSRKLS